MNGVTQMRHWHFPRIYLHSVLRQIGALLLLVVIGIEALFISDKILTNLLFVALENGLGPGFLARSSLLALPEILFLGLPLGVAIAVYVVLLQRREAGDFVILAQVGLSPVQIVTLCVALGAISFLLAMASSGFIRPHAEHQLHKSLHEARYVAFATGQTGARNVIQLNETTFVFHQTPGKDTDVRVFIHRPAADGEEQVVTARDSRVLFRTEQTDGIVTLSDAEIHDFLVGDQIEMQRKILSGAVNFSAETLIIPAFRDRLSHLPSMTLTELLGPQGRDSPAAREAVLRILMAAVVAFLAPALAALAMALTRGAFVLLAGPGAVAAIFAAGFSVEPLARLLSRMDIVQAVAVGLAGGLLICFAVVVLTLRAGNSLMIPAQLRV